MDSASYRYRHNLPIVLKNISFEVQENEKIGIVGRTASGKSTMTLGLLRILEICEHRNVEKGRLIMNKTDVSQIGLHFLRHEVAMIPQEPLLFSGTLIDNIDPLKKYTEEEMENSLRKVHIWEDLKEDCSQSNSLKKKLYSKID